MCWEGDSVTCDDCPAPALIRKGRRIYCAGCYALRVQAWLLTRFQRPDLANHRRARLQLRLQAVVALIADLQKPAAKHKKAAA